MCPLFDSPENNNLNDAYGNPQRDKHRQEREQEPSRIPYVPRTWELLAGAAITVGVWYCLSYAAERLQKKAKSDILQHGSRLEDELNQGPENVPQHVEQEESSQPQ